MDFSKLTDEQLLEYIKNTSPEMLQYIDTLSTPNMLEGLRRGYDPNIMLDKINKTASVAAYPDNFIENVDYGYLEDSGLASINGNSYFPSDDVGLPFDIHDYPAYDSAQAILANNRQIGDSDYTIDDLRANGMSDTQLLELLRNLTNKGYKI